MYKQAKLTYAQVEANNLTAYTQYYYQFNVCNSNKTSVLGRTKTTPDANDYTAKVGLAVYSCSNYRKIRKFTKQEQLLTYCSIWFLQRLRQPRAQGFRRLRPPLGRLHLRICW